MNCKRKNSEMELDRYKELLQMNYHNRKYECGFYAAKRQYSEWIASIQHMACPRRLYPVADASRNTWNSVYQ